MKQRGFTLIELLVVVLIIGILAAIALPQYQKAIMQSRFTQIKTLTRALANAEEAYYLIHGNYTSHLEDLDITPPAAKGKQEQTNWIDYRYDWGSIDVFLDEETKSRQVRGTLLRANEPFITYEISLNHSVNYPQRFCNGESGDETALNNQICKADTHSSTPLHNYSTYIVWKY